MFQKKAVRKSSRTVTVQNGQNVKERLDAEVKNTSGKFIELYNRIKGDLKVSLRLTADEIAPCNKTYNFNVFAPPKPNTDAYPLRFIANRRNWILIRPSDIGSTTMRHLLRTDNKIVDCTTLAIKEQAFKCTLTKSEDGSNVIKKVTFTIKDLATRPIGEKGRQEALKIQKYFESQLASEYFCYMHDSKNQPILAYFGVYKEEVTNKEIREVTVEIINDGLTVSTLCTFVLDL
ncbi:hypothetical protein EIP86_004416 [Pleurotus ostreatoroseus]|nr:hypothetical protein EIP86_004416 [Pleurotus ostreatoroseus]